MDFLMPNAPKKKVPPKMDLNGPTQVLDGNDIQGTMILNDNEPVKRPPKRMAAAMPDATLILEDEDSGFGKPQKQALKK